MPRGSKAAYTDKQKRKARHIEESYEDRGVSGDEAERRAWATVNKQDDGARKKSAVKKKASSPRKKAAAPHRRNATSSARSSRKTASSSSRS